MLSRYIEKYRIIISENLGPNYIRFPRTEEEITDVKMRFEEMYDFPGMVGVIDGTHVALSAVPKEIEIAYVNRKQIQSINVQIVCDSNLIITNINARYPGSTHDSYIFRSSRLHTFMQHYHITHNNEWTWLLGNISFTTK